MRSAIRYIGLDVHKDTVTIAQAIGDGDGEPVKGTDPAEDPPEERGQPPRPVDREADPRLARRDRLEHVVVVDCRPEEASDRVHLRYGLACGPDL